MQNLLFSLNATMPVFFVMVVGVSAGADRLFAACILQGSG